MDGWAAPEWDLWNPRYVGITSYIRARQLNSPTADEMGLGKVSTAHMSLNCI